MKISQTNLEGLLISEPKVYRDERGSFFESWRSEEYKDHGVKECFVQDNISINHKNVLRGLHVQKNMGQLITVSLGIIWDVALDIRLNSSTFGQYFATKLSGDAPQQIYMPPGFAHGFCVLTNLAIINYKCTEYYNPDEEGGVAWNDPDINIPWPIKKPLLSSKDQRFPFLRNLK